ncbi:quinone oxidoreductase family protein [Paludibacterium purpuratum]|uniref:NADPH2:quinone reductase n=1 Tax=Paludibacterium purpuratum TaxID=1144873 RepID=A0A4R7BBR8_9NEIS|nr:quinone oxidoreductase [Paludibacterium purpuratum]TDR81542.1 NADPH2:quinone reductase [Paludibacterium purpuratum]
MKALTFSTFGEPDVLEYIEIPDPRPTPGCAIVRTEAIGLNFADIYRRRGNYHLQGQPPFIAGYEAAGTIISFEGACPFPIGTRVVFADAPFANAEQVSVPFDKLIALPDDISADIAAAAALQGLTAQYLVSDSHKLQAGETVLIHAAAGGVGLLLVQMAKRLGAKVVGLTSRADKMPAVREAGADEVLLYNVDWARQAQALGRDGQGVDVVYESVGTTLLDSLSATRIGGHVVFYGMAAGDPPHIDPRMLMDGSKTLSGGDLWNVLTSASERRQRAAVLFDWIRRGDVRVNIAKRFALADGAQAHAFLESRRSSGKVLLIP